jgi:hypothetical protein
MIIASGTVSRPESGVCAKDSIDRSISAGSVMGLGMSSIPSGGATALADVQTLHREPADCDAAEQSAYQPRPSTPRPKRIRLTSDLPGRSPDMLRPLRSVGLTSKHRLQSINWNDQFESARAPW